MAGISSAADQADEGLETVLADYLRSAEEGRAPDRMELLARHPDLAPELAAFFAGQDRFGRLAAPLREAVSAVQESTIKEKLAEGGRLGDFRIVREIGRGGMGVVFEAEQITLRRRVALKVLPFASTLDAKQLQRFKNEAQAAAQLHHQSIVPVYATGCERGVHYYAMQFIEGQTLGTLIRQLRQLARSAGPEAQAATEPHGKENGDAHGSFAPADLASELASGKWAPVKASAADPQPTGTYSPLPSPDSILPANTSPPAAFSTEHSTKNRAYFRTVAGLGIHAAEALEHAHEMGVVHRDVKPANLLVDVVGNLWITDFGLAHCASQAGLTMTGDLVGTLRYMSPEQALAKRVVVDHRTDIYSLGATLYELLTLQPAYAENDRQELLRQIAFEEPRPPRRINKSIPAELETIVLKAMEKNPADRYATAQQLADDLRRFVEDKPIHARRSNFIQKARKWTRRHKGIVRAATGSAMAVLAVSIIVVWAEKQEASVQRDAAVKNYRRARQAVDEMLTRVGDETLKDIPEMEEVRRDLLNKALVFYQEFLQEDSRDPELRLETGRAYKRVALINSWLEKSNEAKLASRKSVEIVEALSNESPRNLDYKEALADSYAALANIVEFTDHEEAYQHYHKAIAIFDELMASEPHRPTYFIKSATTCRSLGQMERLWKSKPLESEELLRKAVAILDQRLKDEPSNHETRREVGKALGNLGRFLCLAKRPQESETTLRRALEIRKSVAADFPKNKEDQQCLADTFQVLALALIYNGRFEEVLELAERDVQVRERLAEDFPRVPGLKCAWSTALQYRARSLGEMGLHDQADRSSTKALEVLERVVTDFPDQPQFVKDLGVAHVSRGNLLIGMGLAEQAREAYAKAISIFENLVARYPDDPDHAFQLAEARYGVASARHKYNAWEALQNLRRFSEAEIQIRKKLAVQDERECRECITILEKLVAEQPATSDHVVDLGFRYLTLANDIRDNSRLEEAMPWYAKAIDTQNRVLEKEPQHVNARWYLSDAHLHRAIALAHAGEHTRAIAEAKAQAEQKNLTGRRLYWAACAYSLAAAAVNPLAQTPARTFPEDAKALMARYQSGAVALLRQAFAKGWKNVEHTKKDPDLDNLREREDFKSLLTEMEAKAKSLQKKSEPSAPKSNKPD